MKLHSEGDYKNLSMYSVFACRYYFNISQDNMNRLKIKNSKKKAPTIYVKAITVRNRSKMSLMFSILKGVKIE